MEIKEGKDFSSQSREREKERIMSQSLVSNWNLKQQRQEPDEDEGKRSSHVQNRHQNPPVPKPDYEVTELTWENGNLAMHGLCGLGRAPPSKPMWCQVGGTLESVIHQATHNKRISSSMDYNNNPENMNSVVASSGGRWAENSTEDLMGPDQKSKRARSKTSPQRRQLSHGNSNGTSFLDTDTTMWASFESPASLKTKTADEDSSCRSGPENIDEELENKNGNGPPLSSRRSRSAAIHNQSERRRRDRINEKMKALQKLVPNSSKTDKASMLDEVIEYLKQLQAQLQMMSMRSMPQMMMPLGVQPHLQMSLLAGMGMGMSMGTGMGMGTSMGGGMGLGLVDMTRINHPTPPIPPILHPPPPAAAATFVPSPFILPAIMRPHTTTNPNSDPTTHPPIPLHDPYSAFFTQTMNIDLYNKMAALYQQQFNQTTQSNSSKHENQVPHD